MKACVGLLVASLVLVPLGLGGCGSSEPENDEAKTVTVVVTPTPATSATATPVATATPLAVVTATPTPAGAAVASSELDKNANALFANNPNYSDAEKSYLNDLLPMLGKVDSAINLVRAGGDLNAAMAEIAQAKAFFTRWTVGPERFAAAHPLFLQGVNTVSDGITKWQGANKTNSIPDLEAGKNLVTQGAQSMNVGVEAMKTAFKNSPLKPEENGYVNNLKAISDSVKVQLDKLTLGSPNNPYAMDATLAELQRLSNQAKALNVPARFAAPHGRFVQGIDTCYQAVTTMKNGRDNLDKSLFDKAADQMGTGRKLMGDALVEIGQNIVDSAKQ